MRRLTWLAAVVAVAFAPRLASADVIVSSVQETEFGNQLAGTKVTVTFGNGATETATWAANGPTSGAATGTGWSLTLSGDTFFSSWNLTNSRNVGGSGTSAASLIKSILIQPLTSNSVFDKAFGILGLQEGTPGSSLGTTFNGIPVVEGFSSLATVDVNTWFLESANLTGSTYGNNVALANQSAVGDLKDSLLIDIDSVSGLRGLFVPVSANGLPGLVGGGATTFSFRADTDIVTPIPEPATMGVFGLVAFGAGIAARRKRHGATA